jgi:hypothetical protein
MILLHTSGCTRAMNDLASHCTPAGCRGSSPADETRLHYRTISYKVYQHQAQPLPWIAILFWVLSQNVGPKYEPLRNEVQT